MFVVVVFRHKYCVSPDIQHNFNTKCRYAAWWLPHNVSYDIRNFVTKCTFL